MKILQITESASPAAGGPIEGVLQLSNAFTRLGLGSNEVVTLDQHGEGFLAKLPIPSYGTGVRPRSRYPVYRPLARIGWTPKLIPWLQDNARQYDAIIVNGLWNYAIYAASRVLPKTNVPYFVFPHGMLDPWFRKASPLKHYAKQLSWLLSEGPLLEGAKAVLFTTEEERSLAMGAFSGHSYQGRVVGFGTGTPPDDTIEQVAAFRAAVPRLAGRPYILFLGRIDPKKGCDILIDAFAQVAGRNSELCLVVAGPDPKKMRSNLELSAAAAGIADRVIFTGMLTGNVKWGAYRSAQAFALPSHQENFGVAVVEALACGVPVLISNKVNIWSTIVAEGAGIVTDDSRDGARAMLDKFLDLSPAQLRNMKECACISFRGHFHIDTYAMKLASILSEGGNDGEIEKLSNADVVKLPSNSGFSRLGRG